jgi:hypothetical protein
MKKLFPTFCPVIIIRLEITINNVKALAQFTKHRSQEAHYQSSQSQHIPRTQINKINTKGKKIKFPTKFNKQKCQNLISMFINSKIKSIFWTAFMHHSF